MFGVNPVAYSDYGVEVVVLDIVVFTVSGSYREIFGN